jgi:hypothetical protein
VKKNGKYMKKFSGIVTLMKRSTLEVQEFSPADQPDAK